MLKKREVYTATKGVENEGYDYEVGMLSFYCIHLCYNDIEDFKIAIYDDQYHPFDDIVIDITTKVTEKYAIQLKHVKDKLVLNSNHFGKNGKMVLSKYFKYDFSKSNHVLLLTNGIVTEEMTIGNCHMKVKTCLGSMEQCLDTSEDKENHVYEICNDETSNKITFYTAQKNLYETDKAIKQKFKDIFLLANTDSVVQKFKFFFQQWKKGHYGIIKLDKQDIKMKIAEILFYDYMVDYKPQLQCSVDKKTELLHKVLNSYNITIIEKVEERNINNLCGFNIEKSQIIEDGSNLLVLENNNSHKELAMIMWRLNIFPLIVDVNEENIETIRKLIHNLQSENLCFVLIGQISRKDFNVEKVFENLRDLERNELYNVIIQQFKLSIQEQDEISLQKLVECNSRFSEIITMKELLQISSGNLLVDKLDDPLPQPYISRRLITKIIEISSLEHFPNDLFVISGDSKILRRSLLKWKIWKFEDLEKKISLGNRLPPKSIVLCDQNTKSFSTCLKYRNSNVHCMKVVGKEHLQLIYSKQQNANLKQFQIIPEKQLHEISKNNINLVCAGSGMGKLTMLKYLKRYCPPAHWTVKIDLRENNYYCCTQDDASFASKVKSCFKEVNRIILFFCGIDNLRENTLKRAIEHILRLSKDFKIWIFSEDHLRQILEKTFNIASMDIEQFTEEEQKKYMTKRLGEKVYKCLENQLKSFKMLKNDDILGTPMHLYMLSEIFVKNPNAYIKKDFVLTDIYRYFIKTKYEHYLSKVCSEQHNEITEDGIYYRTEQYKLAAISHLDSVYFKNMNVQCDNHFLNQIKNIGDVVGIIFNISADGSIIFSQQTYADYFAALWLANNFRKVENMKNYIFKEEFKNIFFMFNLEVCKDYPAHIAVLYQNHEQLQHYQDEFKELDPLKRSLLHLACSHKAKYPKLQIIDKERFFKVQNKEEVQEEVESKRIVNFLIENIHFNPFQKDELFNWSHIDYAFNMLNIYAIEKILSTNPETLSTVFNKLNDLAEDLFTVIYYSVKFGYINLLKVASTISFFLETASTENCTGETLLHLAVRSGNPQTVTLLLNRGIKIDSISSTHNKRSALHQAVECDNKDIVKLILEGKGLVDIMDRYRTTPLHIACSKGAFDSAEILLKYGADVNFADNFGRTPLQLAATHGHIKIIKLLLDYNTKIDKCDKFGKSALSFATENKHQKIIDILSKEGATSQINMKRLLESEVDEYRSYQLHWVARMGQVEGILYLLQDGWNINEKDSFGRTPLYRAVAEKQLKATETLINKNAEINIADKNKISPLCKSINNGDYEMTKLLLENGASTDCRDNFNYTPLHWAAMFGNPKIVTLLLDKNSDVDAVDNFGRKPVDCAVERGHYNVASLLENDPISKLTEIARKRYEFLIHYASIFENVNDTSKLTPFQDAVNLGNYSLVRKFISLGENLNEVDFYGYSILRRAVIKKHAPIVELLLQNEADIYTKDSRQTSILHLAALCSNIELIKLLTTKYINVNDIDSFGYNPLELAAMSGNCEAITVLLQKSAFTDVTDSCSNTPLQWAAKKGHIKCVKALMGSAVADTIQENILDMVRKQHHFFKIIKVE